MTRRPAAATESATDGFAAVAVAVAVAIERAGGGGMWNEGGFRLRMQIFSCGVTGAGSPFV